MDAVLPLITAVAPLISAGAGVLGGYLLGTRQARVERLYNREAKVISEIYKRLYRVQQAFVLWTNMRQPAKVDRDQQRQQATECLDDLRDYLFEHSVWLVSETADKVEAFLGTVFEMGFTYLDDLNDNGYPKSRKGHNAGARIVAQLQPLRRQLEQEFRAILHPSPWWKFWR